MKLRGTYLAINGDSLGRQVGVYAKAGQVEVRIKYWVCCFAGHNLLVLAVVIALLFLLFEGKDQQWAGLPDMKWAMTVIIDVGLFKG